MVDETEKAGGSEVGDGTFGARRADVEAEGYVAHFDRTTGTADKGCDSAMELLERDRTRTAAPGFDHERVCGDILIGDTIVGTP